MAEPELQFPFGSDSLYKKERNLHLDLVHGMLLRHHSLAGPAYHMIAPS